MSTQLDVVLPPSERGDNPHPATPPPGLGAGPQAASAAALTPDELVDNLVHNLNVQVQAVLALQSTAAAAREQTTTPASDSGGASPEADDLVRDTLSIVHDFLYKSDLGRELRNALRRRVDTEPYKMNVVFKAPLESTDSALGVSVEVLRAFQRTRDAEIDSFTDTLGWQVWVYASLDTDVLRRWWNEAPSKAVAGLVSATLAAPVPTVPTPPPSNFERLRSRLGYQRRATTLFFAATAPTLDVNPSAEAKQDAQLRQIALARPALFSAPLGVDMLHVYARSKFMDNPIDIDATVTIFFLRGGNVVTTEAARVKRRAVTFTDVVVASIPIFNADVQMSNLVGVAVHNTACSATWRLQDVILSPARLHGARDENLVSVQDLKANVSRIRETSSSVSHNASDAFAAAQVSGVFASRFGVEVGGPPLNIESLCVMPFNGMIPRSECALLFSPDIVALVSPQTNATFEGHAEFGPAFIVHAATAKRTMCTVNFPAWRLAARALIVGSVYANVTSLPLPTWANTMKFAAGQGISAARASALLTADKRVSVVQSAANTLSSALGVAARLFTKVPINSLYRGLPGFAHAPTAGTEFSKQKFNKFVTDNTKPPRGFGDIVKDQKNVPFSRLTGLGALTGTEVPGGYDEADDYAAGQMQWIEENALLSDAEFGRQYFEGVFCTHIRRMHVIDQGPELVAVKIPARLNPERLKILNIEVTAPGADYYFLDYTDLSNCPINHAKDWSFVNRQAVRLMGLNVVDLLVFPVVCLLKRTKVPGAGPGYRSAVLEPVLIEISTDFAKQVKPGERGGAERWYSYRPEVVDPRLWALAKVMVKVASAVVHQGESHALRTHLIVEPVSVALERTLPPFHPVHALLKPHLNYTVPVNDAARKALLNPVSGAFDKFIATGGPKMGHVLSMRASYDALRVLVDLSLPKDLQKRGFIAMSEAAAAAASSGRNIDYNMLAEQIPEDYVYAIDALRAFGAIDRYVRAVLQTIYGTDDDLAIDDPALLGWYEELLLAYGKQDGPTGTGQNFVDKIPERLTTSVLIEFITAIIYTASVQHAAVNFGQFVCYGYIANAPLHVRSAPPAPVAELPMAHTFKSASASSQTARVERYNYIVDFLDDYLPDKERSRLQIFQVYGLSQLEPRGQEVYLLDRTNDGHANFFNATLWHSNLFHNPCVAFATRLIEQDASIRERVNMGLRSTLETMASGRRLSGPPPPTTLPALPYHWLMPSRVPASIAV